MTRLKAIYDYYLSSTGVCIDSRQVAKNNIFFAIKGDKFDGNAYARSAINNGACIAVIDNEEFYDGQRYILVDDSLACLQEIARMHRKLHTIPLIGLTGTNGKTTTKELINRVLSRKYKVHATTGNLNNHIGVPLSILGIRDDTEIAVIEMGANHVGEIDFLCNIAMPDEGLITNIGRAHLEGFGSFEGVIQAKTELYAYLRDNHRLAFVNSDDPLLLEKSANIEKLTYGNSHEADSRASLVKSIPSLELKWNNKKITTALYGTYNFENIAAAICIGSHHAVDERDIIEAISSYIPDNSRSQIMQKGSNTIYLDAYNANPSSMQASLSNFLQQESDNKVLILGDMLELGEIAQEEHEKILEMIRDQFSRIILVGPEFQKAAQSYGMNSFPDVVLAGNDLVEHPLEDAHILIKGSRGIALEQLLEYI